MMTVVRMLIGICDAHATDVTLLWVEAVLWFVQPVTNGEEIVDHSASIRFEEFMEDLPLEVILEDHRVHATPPDIDREEVEEVQEVIFFLYRHLVHLGAGSVANAH